MFHALILAFIFVSVPATGVAPGDEEPLCGQLRAVRAAPTPAYSANMRVLMDSWNYQNLLPVRTGAVWEQVDNDKNNPSGKTTTWIQNSNTPCQQTVQVCGFSAGPQNNWLITQLINRTVNGTRLPQVSVMLEFEQHGCNIALNCQRTFSTHIFETSSTGGARDVNNYQQIVRVSPADTFGNKVSEIITVNFNTSHTSFYFAIQDDTTCIVITRLIIFHYVCPAQTVSLIHYPETIAFSSDSEDLSNISVSVTCIENAELENGVAPVITCAAGGIWESMTGGGCCCVPGYYREKFNESETCISCPAGMYLSPSNGSCSTCPANSVSEEEGLTQCTCVEGYYRAPEGEEDLPCILLDQESSTEPVNSGKSVTPDSTLTTDSNGPLLKKINDQEVLLMAILPMVLIGVALSTAILILALLIYIRVNKKGNSARKHNGNEGPKMMDNPAGINDNWTTDDGSKAITKNELHHSTVNLKDNPPGKDDNNDDEPRAMKEEVYYSTVNPKDNPARKDNSENESKVTIEEPYYSTVVPRARAADPQNLMLKMEKNCAYGKVLYST